MKKEENFSENIADGVQREQRGSLFRQDIDYGKYGTKTEVVDLNYHQYLDEFKEGRRIIGTAGQAGNYSVLHLALLEGGEGYKCGDDLNMNTVGFRPTELYGCARDYDKYTPIDEEE